MPLLLFNFLPTHPVRTHSLLKSPIFLLPDLPHQRLMAPNQKTHPPFIPPNHLIHHIPRHLSLLLAVPFARLDNQMNLRIQVPKQVQKLDLVLKRSTGLFARKPEVVELDLGPRLVRSEV
jgi:hypothetical protein